MPAELDSKAGDEHYLTTAMSNTDVAQDDFYYSIAMDLPSETRAVPDALKRAKFGQVKNGYLVAVEAEHSNSAMETTYVEIPVDKNYSITEQETSETAQNQDLTTAETNLGYRPVGNEYTDERGGPSQAADSQISPIRGTHTSIKPVENDYSSCAFPSANSKLWD